MSPVRMRVRLLRKLAQEINGIDLSSIDVGEVVDLAERQSRMLIAEGWAIAERRTEGPARVIAFRRETDLGRADDDDVSKAS